MIPHKGLVLALLVMVAACNGKVTKNVTNGSLQIAIVATPAGGGWPLSGVDLTVTRTGGDQTGDLTCAYDCDASDGVSVAGSLSAASPLVFTDACSYAKDGVFVATVRCTQGSAEAEGTVVIPVGSLAYGEYIIPRHSVVDVGSTVYLTGAANNLDGGQPYTYEWELLYKPTDSTSSLADVNPSTVSISLDRGGYYIVKMTLYKNELVVGTDYAYVGTPSVVHYVNDDATGANTGDDWSNAWTSLPKPLVRGHTYYVADGAYPGYYCDTPQDDVIPIFIMKAVGADHGTDTGWDTTSMGSAQAVFLVSEPVDVDDPPSRTPFIFNANYIEIDGQVGYGDGTVEKHGFRFYNAAGPSSDLWHASVMVGDINGNSSNVHHISIKHSEIAKPGCDNSLYRGRGFYVSSMVDSLTYLLLHKCFIHDIPGISIYFVNTRYSAVEYCYVARNHSDAVSHGEGIQTGGDCSNNIVRYNTWEDIEGTAIIVGDTGWEVYGNLAFYTPDYVNTEPLGRHAPGVTCSQFVGMGFYTTTGGGDRTNCKIYNNTVVGNNTSLTEGGTLGLYLIGTGNVAYNNIFASCRRLRITVETGDYNLLYNNINDGDYAEPHLERASSDPFIDGSSFDYHLKVDTVSGIPLEEPYGYDMDGKKRGFAGNWSRGAFQY